MAHELPKSPVGLKSGTSARRAELRRNCWRSRVASKELSQAAIRKPGNPSVPVSTRTQSVSWSSAKAGGSGPRPGLLGVATERTKDGATSGKGTPQPRLQEVEVLTRGLFGGSETWARLADAAGIEADPRLARPKGWQLRRSLPPYQF